MPPRRRLPWLAVLDLPRDVLASMAITVAVAFGNGSIASVLAPISRDFNLEDTAGTALAALIASFALARLFINLPIGALVDRVRLHPLFYGGGALAIVGVIVTVSAPFYWLLLIGRIVEGAGSITASAAAQAYVARQAPERERGRMLGAVSSATMMGGFLSPVVVGAVATVAHWRIGMLLTVLAILAGMFMVKRYVKDDPPPVRPSESPRSPRESPLHFVRRAIYSPGRLLLVNGMAMALAVPIFGFKAFFYPLFGGEVLDLQPFLIGIAISLSTLMRFPVAIVAGAMSDRYGRLWVYVPSALAMGLVSVLVSQAGNAATYVLFGLAFGLGGGAIPTITSTVVDRAPRDRLGAALGTHAFLRDIGVALTPLGLGVAVDILDFTSTAFTMLAFAALSALLAIAAGESAPAARRRSSA